LILDTYRPVETPEGVELQMRAAGPVVRALAWGIDFLIRGAIYYGLGITLAVLGRFGIGLFLIAIFLLEWFYPVLFEVLRQGQTPGKQVMGIYVAQDNGAPVGWGPAMIRNLLRAVDFLPVFYGFGLISVLLSKDFKRLGDIAAGTRVVYREAPGRAAAIPEYAPVAPVLPLNIDEQRAVIAFAERAPRLTETRAAELAEILTPLLRLGGTSAIQRLNQVANWLVGRR
jgi:uncharacterized RDD family membrane protein YckC